MEEEGKSSAALSTGSFRSPRGGGGGGGVGGGFGLCQVRSVEQLKRAVRKTPSFETPFILKMITVLPRQARDKQT
eukprot:COSAG06_NODE_14_length_35011_cov_20.984132_3_plen_75_part_00